MNATMNGHRRAILYARVSTDEQANNYSLPSQLGACRKYAEAAGFAVVASLTEDYTGTIPIEQRPEGRKAYAMLAGNEADALIVYTMDRLVRPPDDGDEWDTPILIRSLAKLGREIHTVNRGKLGTSFAELLLAMLDARSAGDERRKLLERTSRGRKTKASNGQVVGNGIFPYGYRKTGEGRTAGIAIHEAEARIVRLIFEWYVLGDGKSGPMSFAGIAARLMEMGISTPGASRAHRKIRTRPASAWDYGTVRFILENPVYIGEWHWAGAVVPVPPIVTRDVFTEAQKRREYNRNLSRHNKSRQYLLSGMVACVCGRAMVGTATQKPHERELTYYQCTDGKRKHKGEATCNQRLARAERAEAAAWRYVLDILTNPETFEAELRKAQAADMDTARPSRERLEYIREMIAESEREADDLARALGKAGGVVGQSIERQIADVNQRHAKLVRERDKLQAEIERLTLTDDEIERALVYRRNVVDGLQNATFEDKREIFRLLQVQVTIRDQTATVRCRVPVGGNSRDFDLNAS